MSRVGVQNDGLSSAQRAELKRVFDIFDKNLNGKISQREYNQAIKELKKRDPNFQIDATTLMMESDADGNRQVTFEEFADAARYKTNASGATTDNFNIVVRLVAKYHAPESQHDYLKEYKFWPPPLFMICFSIIQISVFAYYASRDCDNDVSLECPLSFSSKLAFRPGCREQVWRFIMYIFVHAGIAHILFNILVQLLIGIPLEMVHGPFRVCILYLLGGFYAALASSVVDSNANVVGASGAVYALLGAHVADVLINWAEMPFRWIRAGLLGSLIGLDTALAIYTRYFADDEDAQKVSYTGHFAGFMLGATLGTAVLKNLKRTRPEIYLKWIGIVGVIVFFIIALFFNIFYDYNAKSCPS